MKTPIEDLRRKDNDYTDLEHHYREVARGKLALDLEPSLVSVDLKLTVSVVITAWNARGTIHQTLISIAESSFARRYCTQLEAIVVDDGSTDGTWELLSRLNLNLNWLAVRQDHHSDAAARNTGLAVAQGDIIISCDADMVLNYHTIEELAIRHQVLGRGVLLVGFRSDIDPNSPLLVPSVLPNHVATLGARFLTDNRLTFDCPGWPENLCVETDHLKRFGGFVRLLMPSGLTWHLPKMVFGCLFSVGRDAFDQMGGFPEDFIGWGYCDTFVAAQAIRHEHYVVPVYGATGLHIAHGDRSPRKWAEASRNRVRFEEWLRHPAKAPPREWRATAARRIREISRRTASDHPGVRLEPPQSSPAQLADSWTRAQQHLLLGEYMDAANLFALLGDSPRDRPAALLHRGIALRAAGRAAHAVDVLQRAARTSRPASRARGELALALAAVRRFKEAGSLVQEAISEHPTDGLLRYIVRRSEEHMRRAQSALTQGLPKIARRDFEAVLIQNPMHRDALRGLDRTLDHVDHYR